jgi:hypothetical protein
MFSSNATSDCRLARAAAAANPVNVAELVLKCFGVCGQIVSRNLHVLHSD